MPDPAPRISIGIVLFDGVEELDFAGPWEVFTMAAEIGAPVDVFTLGWRQTAIRCAKGLQVTADYVFEEAPRADVVLVPGGRGTRSLALDTSFIDSLRAYLTDATWQTSVCTGAALLGRAGFLDGRRATSNRNAFDFFRASAPNAIHVDDQRFVRDGNVVTSAGVSAGIDMSLWLVGQLFGDDLGRSTQTYMEYFPEPPYGTAAR